MTRCKRGSHWASPLKVPVRLVETGRQILAALLYCGMGTQVIYVWAWKLRLQEFNLALDLNNLVNHRKTLSSASE